MFLFRMSKLDSVEWRNVNWVILPVSAVVCWLLWPSHDLGLQNLHVEFQDCSSVAPLPQRARACRGHHQQGRMRGTGGEHNSLLAGEASINPPCSCSSPVLHAVLACQACVSHLQHLRGGEAPSFISWWTLSSFACMSGSGHLTAGWVTAWQLGFAIKGTRVTGCFFWFLSPSFWPGYFYSLGKDSSWMRKKPTTSRHIYTIRSLYFFACWFIFAHAVLSLWDLFACFKGLLSFSFFQRKPVG